MAYSVALAMMAGCSTHAGGFRGDGVVVDHGREAYYPRFEIRLRPAVSLAVAGHTSYRLHGVPSEPLTLMLRLDQGGEYESLKQLSTIVDVEVKDARGVQICRASGALSTWTLAWSRVGPGAFWQRACTELLLRSDATHQITMTVREIDAKQSGPRVTVVLQGGGKDAP